MKLEVKFMPKTMIESHIEGCEGRHVQQVIYSTYHTALTQICFGCKRIRTSLKEEDLLADKDVPKETKQ